MATIIMIVLLTLILIFIGANLRSLHHLGRELKLVEQQQLNRLKAPAPAAAETNTTPASPPE